MNILALIGSLRKDSFNRKLYENYRSLSFGHTFTEGVIADFPLYNEDVQKAGIPAAVNTLAEQIKAADALLFLSPEYNYSVPGVLKNAIDWISRLNPQPFAGKAAAIAGASPGRLGTARMQYHLRQIGVFLDLQFVNKPEIMISGAAAAFDAQGKLTDESTVKLIGKHIEALEKLAGNVG